MKSLSLIIIAAMVLAGGLRIHVCAQSTSGNDKSGPAPKPILDFSHDPCGSPLVESQLYQLIQGRIEAIEDNRTLLLVMPEGSHRLHVRLAGISPDRKSISSKRAKAELARLGINQAVEVLVNPEDWNKKAQKQVVGVVQLKEGMERDIALVLLKRGLAHTETPAPYAMSNYTFCQYRRAEKDAQSK